jgi:hypothetical protein
MTETDLLRSLEFDPQFQWAVADPPWYEEHYEGFISAASRLILPAGRLFLSVLPRLTRPSAASDRFRIIEIAMNFGFDLVEINPSVLEYESPRFEIEALRTEGVFIEDWRKGDLFTFVLSSHVRVASDHLRSKNQDEWTTIQLGVTTIRIKQDQADTFSYRPASPSGDPRLHSVSRRSAVRSEINLWSSRNIALVVSKSAILAEALTAISEGTSPIETVKRVARTYQISEVEKETLREVLQLLIQDAGLSWKD